MGSFVSINRQSAVGWFNILLGLFWWTAVYWTAPPLYPTNWIFPSNGMDGSNGSVGLIDQINRFHRWNQRSGMDVEDETISLIDWLTGWDWWIVRTSSIGWINLEGGGRSDRTIFMSSKRSTKMSYSFDTRIGSDWWDASDWWIGWDASSDQMRWVDGMDQINGPETPRWSWAENWSSLLDKSRSKPRAGGGYSGPIKISNTRTCTMN